MAQAADPRSALVEINRFVSTFAAALRVVVLYRLDHKVLDEVMQNVHQRLQTVPSNVFPLRIRIGNFSLTYNGEKVGAEKVVDQLASIFRVLGFKEIVFTPPVQSRFFHQLLTVAGNKEANEVKLEKLSAFIGEGDGKPIALVPISSNIVALRLSDEQILKKLAPLFKTAAEGGSGFFEEFQKTDLRTLPDLFTWICVRAMRLPDETCDFIRNLTDATRDGFFPIGRYLRLLPLSAALKAKLMPAISETFTAGQRRPTPLGQSFLPARKKAKNAPFDWLSHLVGFDAEEIQKRRAFRTTSVQQSALEELDLADALIKEGGASFTLGFRFLLRYLGDNNALPVQEKALKIGLGIWEQSKQWSDDPSATSLFSILRQHLTSPSTLALSLFPLRNATIESSEFTKTTAYLISLGDAALPPLLKSLEAEQDRAMRRKLCFIIAHVARQSGSALLVESLSTPSPFLLRNLLVILGDIKETKAAEAVMALTRHAQKIVRVEAVRALCKFGLPNTVPTLLTALSQSPDMEARKIALDYLLLKKPEGLIDTLVRLAKDGSAPADWRKQLYTGIASLGGPSARAFLESLTQEKSFLGRFNTDQRDEIALIKSLLEKLPA